MGFSDLLQIAIKHIKGRWAVMVAFALAISAFCLSFAGAVLLSVSEEKSAPFALVAVTQSQGGITDAMLTEIGKIADVENATPVFSIPVQMSMGEYMAQLTLTGIKPAYLENHEGLPDAGVMPYILLNEAACKLFLKEDEVFRASAEAPKIDWLHTKVTLSTGEGSTPVTAKVNGLLSGERDDEPAAYISLNAAKALLRTFGQPTLTQTAYIRIKNIGYAESVIHALNGLGLVADNADTELQAKWDSRQQEMTYLFILGAFALLCAAAVLFAWQRISRAAQQTSYDMLFWLGMKQRDILRVFLLQSALLSAVGAGLGLLFAVILPLFLSQSLIGLSIFMLPIPIPVILFCFVLSMAINLPFALKQGR